DWDVTTSTIVYRVTYKLPFCSVFHPVNYQFVGYHLVTYHLPAAPLPESTIRRAAIRRATIRRATIRRATVRRATIRRATIRRATVRVAISHFSQPRGYISSMSGLLMHQEWFSLSLYQGGISSIHSSSPPWLTSCTLA